MVQFTSVVTPNAAAIFSPLQFSQKIDKNLPVKPAVTFANPVGRLYGAFSYDKMNNGAQWSALWYRLADHVLICTETKPWDGGTGGYGYTECNPSSEQWQPGDYEVQIFVGVNWENSGRFSVTGAASDANRHSHPFQNSYTDFNRGSNPHQSSDFKSGQFAYPFANSQPLSDHHLHPHAAAYFYTNSILDPAGD